MKKFVAESLFEHYNNITKLDESTLSYMNSKISYREWSNYIDNINEGKIGDYIQQKVLPILKTIAGKMKTAGKKGIKALQKMYGIIKKFMKNNPVLFKFLVVLIVLLLVMVTTASAAVTGGNELVANPEFQNWNNAVLGFLDTMGQDLDQDFMVILKAKAHLVDLKDGNIDNPEILTESVKAVVEAARNTIDIINKDGGIPSKFIEAGKNIIDYAYDKIGSIEKVSLIFNK